MPQRARQPARRNLPPRQRISSGEPNPDGAREQPRQAEATDANVTRAISTLVGLELDHVLIGVADLSAGATEIEARFGLTSVEGGRHPGWGTANRIVPLGESYIELVSVVDDAEARESPFGRWVAEARPGRLLGWAVRTEQLDAVARRLGLTVSSGSRVGQHDRLVQWRLAGVEQAAAESFLPFFIEWAPQTSLPGHMQVTHQAGDAKLASVRLVGDADRLAAWLGDHQSAITVRAGPPAVESILVTRPSGEVVISTLLDEA